MGRPRDVVKWLTGFIGYAKYPRPDVLRPANRLAVARNAWISGTKGIGQRRHGMSLVKAATEPISWVVSFPALANGRMYSMVAFNADNGFFISAAGSSAYWLSWTWNRGAITSAVTLNQKAFLAPASDQPLALIDTTIASMERPAAPTGANTGAGAYAATLRYYRVQWYDGATLQVRGPVSAALSFTPSGAGTGVVVTRPTAPTDHAATEWYLWGSTDDLTYRLLATTAIGTTTVTDSTAPGAYAGDVLTDSLESSPVRTVGMEASAAPSVANTGAGAYAATLRYYRQRWVARIGGVVTRRGEPSASVSFTPSGAGTAARLTMGAVVAEYGQTHWELEASTDNVNFYLLTTVPRGTTTYDDSAATSTYSSGTVSDTIGDFTVPPSARSICADRDRLLFAGGWDAGTYSRVWYTPVLGALNVGDEERVPTDNFFDIEAHDDDEITASIGPVGGSVLIFKRRSFFRLIRTGDEASPYEVIKVAEGVGCDDPTLLCLAPGPTGNEAVYFTNTRGHWRYDVDGGLTRLNDDLAPPWDGQTSNVGRVVYYSTRDVVLFGEYAFCVSTGGWAWMDWTRGHATWQVTMRVQGLEQPILLLPSNGATSEGLYRADNASATTDVDEQGFAAEIRTNRMTLAEATRRWRPVRLRVWGTGGAMVCKTYTASSDVSQGFTPLTTTSFTLGSDREDYDVTGLSTTGPIEWLAFGFEDAASPAAWALDAVEVTGLPQEPVP